MYLLLAQPTASFAAVVANSPIPVSDAVGSKVVGLKYCLRPAIGVLSFVFTSVNFFTQLIIMCSLGEGHGLTKLYEYKQILIMCLF